MISLIHKKAGKITLLHGNGFLLGVILGVVFTACSRHTAPKEERTHNTRSNNEAQTLAETIAQKAQALERAKHAQARTQPMESAQHHAPPKNSVTPKYRNVERANERGEVQNEENTRHESDDSVSIQFPLSTLTESLELLGTSDKRSDDDRSSSTVTVSRVPPSIVRQKQDTEESIDHVLDGFFEQAQDGDGEHSQSTLSEASELEEEKQNSDGSRE